MAFPPPPPPLPSCATISSASLLQTPQQLTAGAHPSLPGELRIAQNNAPQMEGEYFLQACSAHTNTNTRTSPFSLHYLSYLVSSPSLSFPTMQETIFLTFVFPSYDLSSLIYIHSCIYYMLGAKAFGRVQNS